MKKFPEETGGIIFLLPIGPFKKEVNIYERPHLGLMGTMSTSAAHLSFHCRLNENKETLLIQRGRGHRKVKKEIKAEI